jgi:hypothetical protein
VGESTPGRGPQGLLTNLSDAARMVALRALVLAFALLTVALALAPTAQAGIVDRACDKIGGCSYPLIDCSANVQVFCAYGGQTCLVWLVADPGPPDPPAYYCL